MDWEVSKPMNILLVSSRQWRPEDEWARIGLKGLLLQAFGSPINFCLYDTNPDLLAFDGHQRTHRYALQSNSFRHQSLIPFSAIVVAGAQSWCGGSLEMLYGLICKTDIPFFLLGVSLPVGPTKLSELDRQCFSRPNSTLVARDKRTHTFLSQYGLAASLLPSPICFVENPGPRDIAPNRARIGIVLESNPQLGGKGEVTTLSLCKAISSLPNTYSWEIICPRMDDFMRFSTMFRNVCFHSYDPTDYIKKISSLEVIATTNPTVADLANSLEAASLFIQKDNALSEAGDGHLKCRPSDLITGIENALVLSRQVETLRSKKQAAQTQWRSFLIEKTGKLKKAA